MVDAFEVFSGMLDTIKFSSIAQNPATVTTEEIIFMAGGGDYTSASDIINVMLIK